MGLLNISSFFSSGATGDPERTKVPTKTLPPAQVRGIGGPSEPMPELYTTVVKAMPAECVMGQIIIDLYGCEQLSEKFLRTKFDAMDTQKQGCLSMTDLLETLSSCLSMSRRDCETAINAIPLNPGAAISFDDFKAAVSQTLQFQIKDALDQACSVHRSGAVIVLNTEGVPYGFENLLGPLEREAGVENQTKYAIYEDKSGKSSLWRIHAISKKNAHRELFPKTWRGHKGMDLFNNCGVQDCISVSRDGCSATSKSLQGAVALATANISSVQNRQAIRTIERENAYSAWYQMAGYDAEQGRAQAGC